jgi:D-tyrosyl-tRNA(Tyr) deacylase
MIAVVQRVLSAGVFVEEPAHAETIESGLCVLIGIEEGDTQNDGDWMAKKLVNLRIFNDEHEKMNRSLLDTSGELLLISQFTLASDCTQGHRPSFSRAARPEVAEPLVEYVGQAIRCIGVPIKEGVFGAKMRVEIENDGPVTILLQRD